MTLARGRSRGSAQRPEASGGSDRLEPGPNIPCAVEGGAVKRSILRSVFDTSDPASNARGQRRRVLLAKLVIGLSVVVALATSAPPTWRIDEERPEVISLDAAREQKLLLTIRFDGELYADTRQGRVIASLIATRPATDLTLAVRAVGAGTLPAGSDGGGANEILATARPTSEQPHQTSLGFLIACATRDASVERPASCTARFELTLARESAEPVNVNLRLEFTIRGEHEHRPPGDFQISLERLAQ